MDKNVQEFIAHVAAKNPNEPEFLQAVTEVAASLVPFIKSNDKYNNMMLLERMVEPERVIMFRVPWLDDNGKLHINRGYRVQMSSAIGPYKGGLRFHPSVNLSVLKFLAFEQVFKNSLTTLPLGGGKGGSDFDPKGKSDTEIMRFCQTFMSELYRHIGADTDIPAGDIGVGAREVGFLFGQYKKLANQFTGVLTGKSLEWGGSLIRTEATGYGTVYFADYMLQNKGDSFKGKKVLVSGSGNVAQYAAEKVIQLGGTVLTMSDSAGFIYDKEGIDAEKLAYVMELKNVKRVRISEYTNKYPNAEYHAGKRPWSVDADIALPCATQNEIEAADAKELVKNGVICVAEGANMPSTIEAIDIFHDAGVLFAPGKASNAGGVAVSGLEMSQNSQRYSWTREEVDAKLKDIMKSIHNVCLTYGDLEGKGLNYVSGANIGGFVKVADSMLVQGIV